MAQAVIALSDGVFHNALLLGEACVAQRQNGSAVQRHRRMPPTHGGLALSTEESRQQDIAGNPRWRAEFDETKAEHRRRSRQSAE